MKSNYLAAQIAAVILCVMNLAAIGTDVNVDIKAIIGVSTCTGGNATCNVNQTLLNAVGDPFIVKPTAKEATPLGTISSEKIVELALPSNVDGYTLFSFSPSEGDLAGKTVYLALRLSAKGRIGTRFPGFYPVELFRLVEGQNPEKDWLRAGQFRVEGTQGAQAVGKGVSGLSFTFKPNGDASVTGPEKGKITFNLGLEKLS